MFSDILFLYPLNVFTTPVWQYQMFPVITKCLFTGRLQNCSWLRNTTLDTAKKLCNFGNFEFIRGTGKRIWVMVYGGVDGIRRMLLLPIQEEIKILFKILKWINIKVILKVKTIINRLKQYIYFQRYWEERWLQGIVYLFIIDNKPI